MTQRTPEEVRQELQGLDQAHAQNEVARDSFVTLAHTALFAASVSFVGSAVPLAKAVWLPALVAGWAVDVSGLLALTISFTTARKAIDARREALYAETPPIAIWSDRLNGFALWSFPAALLCLFSFVTANVVHIYGQQTKPAPTVTTGRNTGDKPDPAGALAPGRGFRAPGGRYAGAQGTGCPSAAAIPTAVKRIARYPMLPSMLCHVTHLLGILERHSPSVDYPLMSEPNSLTPHCAAIARVCMCHNRGTNQGWRNVSIKRRFAGVPA